MNTRKPKVYKQRCVDPATGKSVPPEHPNAMPRSTWYQNRLINPVTGKWLDANEEDGIPYKNYIKEKRKRTQEEKRKEASAKKKAKRDAENGVVDAVVEMLAEKRIAAKTTAAEILMQLNQTNAGTPLAVAATSFTFFPKDSVKPTEGPATRESQVERIKIARLINE